MKIYQFSSLNVYTVGIKQLWLNQSIKFRTFIMIIRH